MTGILIPFSSSSKSIISHSWPDSITPSTNEPWQGLCHCCHNCYLNLRDGFTKGGCRGGAISYWWNQLTNQTDWHLTLSFRQSNNYLWQHPALENSLVVWVNVVDITTSQMSFIVNLKLNIYSNDFFKIKNTCPTTHPPPRMIFQAGPTILPFLYWPARVNLPFLSKNL